MDKLILSGTFTVKQVIIGVVLVIILGLVMSLFKKTFKFILSGVLLVAGAIYIGLISPEQLEDAKNAVKEHGKTAFVSIANKSDVVKIDESNGFDIQVKVEGNWYSVDEITSFVKGDSGYTISVNGQTLEVSDDGIMQVLDLLKK